MIGHHSVRLADKRANFTIVLSFTIGTVSDEIVFAEMSRPPFDEVAWRLFVMLLEALTLSEHFGLEDVGLETRGRQVHTWMRFKHVVFHLKPGDSSEIWTAGAPHSPQPVLLVPVAPQSLPLERDVVAISAGQRDPQVHFIHMVFHHVLSLAPEVASDADLKSN